MMFFHLWIAITEFLARLFELKSGRYYDRLIWYKIVIGNLTGVRKSIPVAKILWLEAEGLRQSGLKRIRIHDIAPKLQQQ